MIERVEEGSCERQRRPSLDAVAVAGPSV